MKNQDQENLDRKVENLYSLMFVVVLAVIMVNIGFSMRLSVLEEQIKALTPSNQVKGK